MSALVWRPALPNDIAAISAVAAEVHPDFPEDDSVFAERIALAPQGCWLLVTAGGEAMGYVLSHPGRLGVLPALNSLLGALPEDPDTFYIHDLALLPRARGGGAAGEIVKTLIGIGAAYRTMSLVAVNGSIGFWSRFGFALEDRPELVAKLSSYDAHARFMVRR